jgi:hypothetical protein
MKVRREGARTRAVAHLENCTGDHPRVPSLTGRSPHKAPGRTESLTYQCCRWAAVLRGDGYNQPPAGCRVLRQRGKLTCMQADQGMEAGQLCVRSESDSETHAFTPAGAPNRNALHRKVCLSVPARLPAGGLLLDSVGSSDTSFWFQLSVNLAQ